MKKEVLATIVILSILLCTFLMVGEIQKNSSVQVIITHDANLGDILTDNRGMTLYTFTEDKENESNCNDKCAAAWPPLLVDDQSLLPQDIDGKFGVTKRRDNKYQVTFNGKPLYYYVNDKKPGDTFGQNVEKKWFVVNQKN